MRPSWAESRQDNSPTGTTRTARTAGHQHAPGRPGSYLEDPTPPARGDDRARDGELGEPSFGGELPLVEVAQLVERGRLSRRLVLTHPSDAGEAQDQPGGIRRAPL